MASKETKKAEENTKVKTTKKTKTETAKKATIKKETVKKTEEPKVEVKQEDVFNKKTRHGMYFGFVGRIVLNIILFLALILNLGVIKAYT